MKHSRAWWILIPLLAGCGSVSPPPSETFLAEIWGPEAIADLEQNHPARSESYWRARLDAITPGMTEQELLAALPPPPVFMAARTSTGGATGLVYPLDRVWSIQVFMTTSPEEPNLYRLLQPPELIRGGWEPLIYRPRDPPRHKPNLGHRPPPR